MRETWWNVQALREACASWGRGGRAPCAMRATATRAGASAMVKKVGRASAGKGRARTVPPRSDVVGLGQAMVDLAAHVDDAFLDKHALVKGERKVVTHLERARILGSLDGSSYKATAGGSLANTLVALSRLGQGHVQVGMAGVVGSDAIGQFFRAKMGKAGVEFLNDDQPDTSTGTVCVLTTPDANRTMLSFFGSAASFDVQESLKAHIARAKVLVIEGYLWEMEGTKRAIGEAVDLARRHGTLVALTASDATVVHRHHQEFVDLLPKVDVLFANHSEAQALVKGSSAAECAAILGAGCPLVAVTDGSRGSYVVSQGQLQHVAPHWSDRPPVDTCGAGDAYAAGLLFGMLVGLDVAGMADVGAKVASTVIGRCGARLSRVDADRLTSTFVQEDQRWLWEGDALDSVRWSARSGVQC